MYFDQFYLHQQLYMSTHDRLFPAKIGLHPCGNEYFQDDEQHTAETKAPFKCRATARSDHVMMLELQ